MHPCHGKWVVIGCPVVYYARTALAFSAGIKCRYCILTAVDSNLGEIFKAKARLGIYGKEKRQSKHY